MTEHWMESTVRGWDESQKKEITEVILHRRGADPMVLACRRNGELAGLSRIRVSTVELFSQERRDPEKHRQRKDISFDRLWRFSDNWDT